MNIDLVILAACVGFGTWAFRFLPTRLDIAMGAPDSPLGRFMAAIGPAAIATLFIASILPLVSEFGAPQLCVLIGSAATIGAFTIRRNVAIATLSGALFYGLAHYFLI